MALDQVDVDQYEWKDGELQSGDNTEMSFLDHLEELRWHIIRSLIAIAVAGIVLFLFRTWYFNEVILGPAFNDFASYGWFCDLSKKIGAGEALCMTLPDFKIQAVNFAEQFITTIKLCFVGGFVVAFPYVFYEIWKFIAPGLYDSERKATRGIVFICSVLFIMGVLFGFFIIAPFATNFLMGFTASETVANNPTLSSFVLYMVMFTLPAGLIFELPIVVYFLAKLGIVTPEGMRKYRRHSIIGILMLSAILTPPDVVTQFLIGIPLYVLYEISIIVAARMAKKYQQDLQ
ncbi:MAG: twin-arginine translocase subunit TatC [Bacteroidota bacterium]